MRARVQAMLAQVGRLPHVASVRQPLRDAAAHGDLARRDDRLRDPQLRRSARRGLPKSAIERVIHSAPRRALAYAAGRARRAGDRAGQIGCSIGYAFVVGIGAAIVVLLISFGSLLAMGLPIGTALLGLGTGFGLIELFSRVMSMPDFAGELALMIGLGVGVDYALFIVTRYREAYRRNGGDVAAAVGEAMNTAGRAVIFAGMTVVIALMGMFALGVGPAQRVSRSPPRSRCCSCSPPRSRCCRRC